MKIGYKKRQLKVNLILGVVWLVFGILSLMIDSDNRWPIFGYLIMSILYLALYFHQKRNKYLTIENGIIKQNWLFGKIMKLTEIKQIKHFAGDYILKSENKKMTINIQLIDEESLADLKTELKKLNVAWN